MSWNLCFINLNIMFHVSESEIGIMVLNKCIVYTYHIISSIIVSMPCHGAGSIYLETLCICKKSSYWSCAKLFNNLLHFSMFFPFFFLFCFYFNLLPLPFIFILSLVIVFQHDVLTLFFFSNSFFYLLITNEKNMSE